MRGLSDKVFEASRDEMREDADAYDGDGSSTGFLVNADGKRLYTRQKLPAGGREAWKGVCFWLHGLGAHCHRPTDAALAAKLNEAGVAVFMLDHEAHGLSEGLAVEIRDYKNLVRDILQLMRVRLEEHKAEDLPLFVAGESMGGALALHTGLHLQENDPRGVFHGALLFAPAIHNSLEPPAPVTWCLRNVCLAACPLAKPPCMPPIPPEKIWRNPEVRQEMSDDRLMNFVPLRLCTGDAMLRMTHELQEAIPTVRFPFLVHHGTGDLVIPVSGSEYLDSASATPADDKRLVVVEGAYHDAVTDPAGGDVLNTVQEWVRGRLAKAEQ